MRRSLRACPQSPRDQKHLGVRFRAVCHVAAGWRCGQPRGRSRRQGRADTRARRPARPCPSLRREPLSLDRLLFLTKAHTRASAPTIDCMRGIGFHSTGAGRLGRHLQYRMSSMDARRCKTIGLPCGATSRIEDIVCGDRKGRGFSPDQARDPRPRTTWQRPSTSQRVPRFGYPFQRSLFTASKPVEVRYATTGLSCSP